MPETEAGPGGSRRRPGRRFEGGHDREVQDDGEQRLRLIDQAGDLLGHGVDW
ncbi:hypothetical protein [Streptomyces boluensis]|uniref:Uncharacterized protein n=1 Tax=Streptomyces boluensis TaxID=1775135 RepID=A0A964XN73_9ACTN|nr:hypothetical protein [Streptomyces boluensis]NBE55180.1 hypothetical protein [Streptomyces boluensis]